jgi:hypothetical protein
MKAFLSKRRASRGRALQAEAQRAVVVARGREEIDKFYAEHPSLEMPEAKDLVFKISSGY